MPKYLSQEWFDEFRTVAGELLPDRPGASLRVQYLATGGPDGDLHYYWILEDGKLVEARLGTLEDAQCTITSTYENAVRMQQGEITPTNAFMKGKMKVKGNLGKMMSLMPITHSPEWASVEEKVRATPSGEKPPEVSSRPGRLSVRRPRPRSGPGM
jgi:hypothetical protein